MTCIIAIIADCNKIVYIFVLGLGLGYNTEKMHNLIISARAFEGGVHHRSSLFYEYKLKYYHPVFFFVMYDMIIGSRIKISLLLLLMDNNNNKKKMIIINW